MHSAIYAGSFDPITLGHLDIILRSVKLYDKLIIAVGDNIDKEMLFSLDERLNLIKDSLKEVNIEGEVTVASFKGLLVDFAKKMNCSVIIRGLRALSDLDYEFQMALLNRKLEKTIETVFLITDQQNLYLNSGSVKEIVKHGGSVKCMVPESVEKKLKERLSK